MVSMLSNLEPEAETPSQAEATFRSMLECIGLLRRVMHPYFDAFGISASQWAVLRVLYVAEENGLGRLRLVELGERLLIRPPSVTGVVERLEQDGLVIRTPSKQDQRAKEVGLTDKGRHLAEDVLQHHGEQIGTVLDGLETAEQSHLQKTMNRLSTHLRTIAQKLES